jgi:RNA polymerase sigma-70 factor (ECF subfamily)
MKTCKSFARDGKEGNARTAGREGNLDDLLQRNAKLAYNFAYRLAGNVDEAEELVQQASYQVLRHWESYDPLQAFQTWYLTMVKRLFIDIRRSLVYHAAVPLTARVGKEDGRELAEVLADGEPGPLEQLERGEEVAAAQQSLARLNERHRAVLTLCDIECLSYEEAGEILGLPTGTVRSRLSRARAMLRRNAKLA